MKRLFILMPILITLAFSLNVEAKRRSPAKRVGKVISDIIHDVVHDNDYRHKRYHNSRHYRKSDYKRYHHRRRYNSGREARRREQERRAERRRAHRRRTHRNKYRYSINVGTGSYLCAAKGDTEIPYVARSFSRTRSKRYALNKCENKAYDCYINKCLKVYDQGELSFDVFKRKSKNRSPLFLAKPSNNADINYFCRIDLNNKSFKAIAPTKVEARSIAKQICFNKTGNERRCNIKNNGICGRH